MRASAPLPAEGGVFLDVRGPDRVLRVSWHGEADTVVLSLWRGDTCAGSFRLHVADVPSLVDVLRGGLSAAYADHRSALDRLLDGDLAG